MAEITKRYAAKGVLSCTDMNLTEIKKDGIEVHNLEEALRLFEGEEVSITIAYRQEVEPSSSEGE